MKKHFILAALAMTALFSACSNEEENLMTTGNEVTFVIGGVESRTTTTADFTTTFSNDDKVGIFSTNLASDNMSNTSFTVNGTTLNLTAGTNTYTFKGGDESATFNAYYPLQENENVSGTTVTFSISEAQNDATNFNNSDFLTAVASATTGEVELNFNHRMALVQVAFTGLDNISTVTINSVKPTITYDATGTGSTQGTVTIKNDATATNVAMYQPTQGTATYWAIIPAQSISGTLFTVSTSDGKSYSYTPTSTASFTEGNITKYQLKIAGGEDSEELESFSGVKIVAWGNTNEAIDGELTEVVNRLSLTNDFFFSKDITTTTGGFALTADNNTEAKWVYQNATATIEEATEAEGESSYKYIKLVTAANAGSWYNEGVAYLGGETTINTSSTYTLTFDIKGTNSNSQIQIYTVFKEGSTNYVYREQDWVDESTQSGHSTRYLKPKTDWETISINVDPAFYNTGASTSKTLTQTPHANSKFTIAFNITSTGRQENDEFYIKNISFVEN